MRAFFLVCFAFLWLNAVSAADFTAHEGPDVFEGKGGEKTSVDGVDFWLNGASPPRKFRLLGYLTADINTAGLNGLISKKRLPSKIAAQTRELGADAVIVLSEDTRSWQDGGTITAYGNQQTQSANAQVRERTFAKTKTRYAVVAYADAAPAAAAPPR
jgi:hypothetical protein